MQDARTAPTSETIFWRRATWSPGVYWVLGFNVALFALAERWGGSDVAQVIARMGAATNELVAAGEVWRLIASGYLHFGVEHLANNVVAIWFFGRILEGAVGTARFLVLYTLSVLCGAVAHCALPSGGLLAGASGGAFGILGGSLVLLRLAPGLLPPFSRTGYASLLIGYIAISLLLSQFSAASLVAHAGGAAGGAWAVWAGLATWGLPSLGAAAPERPLSQWVVHGLAVGAILATTGAIATGSGLYRPWEIAAVAPAETVDIPGAPISIAVPRMLLARAVSQQVDGVREVSFGDFLFDPLALRITTDLPLPPAASGDLGQRVAGFGDEMLATVAAGEEVRSGPALTRVSEHPWLLLETRSGDARLERWSTVLGGQRINLVIALSLAAPGAWRDAADRVVPSIRVFGPPEP